MKKIEELENNAMRIHLFNFWKRFNQICTENKIAKNADNSQLKYVADKLYDTFFRFRNDYEHGVFKEEEAVYVLYGLIDDIIPLISVLSLPIEQANEIKWRDKVTNLIINEFVELDD